LIYMQQKWCKGLKPRKLLCFGPTKTVVTPTEVRLFVIPSAARNLLLLSFRPKGGICSSCHSERSEESASRLHRHNGRLIFLVGAFEIRDLVIALEVPDAGGHLVDQIVIVRH
jgi:hypothetical protein